MNIVKDMRWTLFREWSVRQRFVMWTTDWNVSSFPGNIETKSEETDTISRNVALRNELDLFVNVLECKSYAGVPARQHDVNIAIVRQNTEGEYAMLEHEVRKTFKMFQQSWILSPWFWFQSVPGVVESMKVVTSDNSERVARYAFEYGMLTIWILLPKHETSSHTPNSHNIYSRAFSQKHRTHQGDHHSQGQHHENIRWFVFGDIASRSQGISRNPS